MSGNYERNLGKRRGGGGGGGLGSDRSKGVYQEGDILIAASSNGDHGEPSLQCIPVCSSTRLPFLTVRFFH